MLALWLQLPLRSSKGCSQWFFNTLRPRQNGRRFADDTFKRIFLNENVGLSIKISLKFVPKGPINNNPALVQIMAWRWSGDKLLSEPMMASLLTHICVTQPQWVKGALFPPRLADNVTALVRLVKLELLYNGHRHRGQMIFFKLGEVLSPWWYVPNKKLLLTLLVTYCILTRDLFH